MSNSITTVGVSFGRNLVGIVTRPYETCRRIVEHGNIGEFAFVVALILCYLLTVSLVKQSLFEPFLLSRQFITLASATGLTLILAVSLFWGVGRLLRATTNLRGLIVGWGYSMIPTLLWFWITLLLYIILPPPRTTRFFGVAFSIVYLIVSAILLFWKVILSYLTLRFAFRMDLVKIVLLSAIVLPILGFYTVGMYRLGIFRIPFI